jgi:hypothetical protein
VSLLQRTFISGECSFRAAIELSNQFGIEALNPRTDRSTQAAVSAGQLDESDDLSPV